MAQVVFRTSDTQKLQSSELSDALNVKEAELFRAILYDGINRVRTMGARDPDKAREFIALMDARARL